MKTPLLLILFVAFAQMAKASAPTSTDEIKKVAEQFVKVVDINDAEALKAILHADMYQYVTMGDKLMPFKGTDFIQMVADKKLGGTPRKISHKSAKILRGNSATVSLSAVSEEYDFYYQLSLAKQDGKWIIVGILVDIVSA